MKAFVRFVKTKKKQREGRHNVLKRFVFSIERFMREGATQGKFNLKRPIFSGVQQNNSKTEYIK